MKTPKDKAAERLKKKYEDAQKVKDNAQEEYKREKELLTQTINTKGWQILVRSLEATVQKLGEDLVHTSSLRVFKGMELRSERKNLNRLLTRMRGEEKKFLSSLLIEKE